jgi:methylenetetrahydrofolate dehydrogenase (NADP+)/methenyltetrahydrofolate cyclohydrolase
MAADNLIDGRAIAEQIHSETTQRIEALKRRGIEPFLIFVRVGEDPASQVYVGMKEKTSQRLGIRSETHVLKESATQQELLELVQKLNEDRAVHGILVQSPIPKQIDSNAIYSAVLPTKDVDGFHPLNVGKLLLGDQTGFVPCTPAGVHELLIRSGVTIKGANVVVLGRGNIVGKPMAADIIVAAMGSAHFVKADMVKPGAAVMDVGVNRVKDPAAKSGSRLVGDVDFANVQPIAGKITPNPGGVGPMTIAMLMRNTVSAAENLTK